MSEPRSKKFSDSQENGSQSLTNLVCVEAGKGTSFARKSSIVLAVVLAIFAASLNLGHAQSRGGGFHGGGFHSQRYQVSNSIRPRRLSMFTLKKGNGDVYPQG